MREILVWPVGKEAEAMNYCDVADAAYALLTNDPTDVIFAYRDRVDVHGQTVTPYFGPTGFEWFGVGVEEPPECLAARADAVLSSFPEWPPEE